MSYADSKINWNKEISYRTTWVKQLKYIKLETPKLLELF